MPSSDSIAARPEVEVFADLQSLCTSPGYVHTIAYFCWRDNLLRYTGSQVTERDLEHQHSHDKLLRSEISTLIGLMIQQPIDLSLPAPDVMHDYVNRTEALLHELHRALQKPWFDGLSLEAAEMPEHGALATAAAMREPIFYGGESAYSFQYRDLARLKYRADDQWLEANKGFQIEDACRIAEALLELQLNRQRECVQSLEKMPPAEWTILPGFMFTTQDTVDASGVALDRVEQFLDAFSCGPEERNTSFNALGDYNVISSAPILKTAHGSYLLFQHYSLLEAIYESPFFWMAADETYSPMALTNRGRFTETFVAERLESVFGANRVSRNVDIYKGKDCFAEADALVLYGDRAIVVQAKSKRLTIEARKGNDLKLKDDFKKAIQNTYDQALRCVEALTNNGFTFVDPLGVEMAVSDKPRIIFPICIVSDHYPALAFQARQFLRTTVTTTIQPPLVMDVFALDVFAEMLDTPLHFLNYLALRASFDDKLVVSQELTALGFHLKQNLWVDAECTMLALDDGFTSALDIAMEARRAGVPGEKTPKGILTRFDGFTIGRLLSEIEKIASPQLTGLGLLLLQLSYEAANSLSKGIDRIVRQTKHDSKSHDLSVAIGTAGSGITIHCNRLPEDVARERLFAHCRMRKYDAKANAWYGLLLDPATGGIRGVLVIEQDWTPDPHMDAVVAVWPKRPPVPVSQLASRRRKIGRNEPCPCGSGRKYKKCCLNAYEYSTSTP